ncbi:MAG: hypothetical protein QOI29_235 [Mycobacterium sp.]|jgi:hypothetical protein|nr:hypothetical protein [Mycobacterium sp.]
MYRMYPTTANAIRQPPAASRQPRDDIKLAIHPVQRRGKTFAALAVAGPMSTLPRARRAELGRILVSAVDAVVLSSRLSG